MYIGYREHSNGSLNLEAIRDLFDAMIEQQLKPALGQHLSHVDVYTLFSQEHNAYKDPAFPKPHPDFPKISHFVIDAFMNDWGTAKALALIKEDPWRALRLVPLKIAHFWNLEHRIFVYAYANNMLGALSAPVLTLLFIVLLGPFVVLTLAGVFGVVFRAGNERHLFLIFSLIAYYTLMHGVTFGEARFHYVIIPFIALLGASGILKAPDIGRQLRTCHSVERRRAWRRLAVASLCCLVFAGIWAYGLHESWDNFKTIYGPSGYKSSLRF